MRRIEEERGAVAVLVAVMLVPLIGLGALVIDIGAIYFEVRQLQNGADAAALAVAQTCAAGGPCSSSASASSAKQYTDANANDGQSNAAVAIPGLDGANSVTVTATTSDDGSNFLTYRLAGALGIASDDTFSRSATAAWGGVGSGATVPLTFSKCEWDFLTGNNVANLPTAERTVYFHSSQTAKTINTCGGPANQNHPGGFGWLNPNGVGCSSNVVLGQVPTDTGNNVPNVCTEQYLRQLIGGSPVLLPVFSTVTSQGNNAIYTIVGFAALEVTGYRFSGNQYNEPAGDVPCSGNDRCIRGRFVAYYALGSEPTTGAPNFGVVTIDLTR